MRRPWKYINLCIIFMLGLDSKLVGLAFQPEFAEPIMNLTVPVGRDATFRCLVQNLGGYRVGWVKADTKAIQAIHVHVITNNHRVGVSHNGQSIWNLHIKNVQEEDRGTYMCQINTDPMKSQTGNLNVVVPPDFIPEETSGDVTVAEGETVKLSCKAKGIPRPKVLWRREDNFDIVIRSKSGKNKVTIFEQDMLTLNKVSRSDMGVYLCIASNGVPPSISKRLMLRVHFPPVIQVPNQLVGAPQRTDVTLECFIESSPKAITFWVKENNEMLVSSEKYEVATAPISMFETRMSLTVRGLNPDDVGGYKCVAKNGLGEVDSIIRLYEIPGPTTTPSTAKQEKKIEDLRYEFSPTTPLIIQDSSSESNRRHDYEEDYIIYSTQNNFITNKEIQRHPINKEKLANQVKKNFGDETNDVLLKYSNSISTLNVQLSTFFLGLLVRNLIQLL